MKDYLLTGLCIMSGVFVGLNLGEYYEREVKKQKKDKGYKPSELVRYIQKHSSITYVLTITVMVVVWPVLLIWSCWQSIKNND